MSQVYLQRLAAAGVAFLGVQTFDCACDKGAQTLPAPRASRCARHPLLTQCPPLPLAASSCSAPAGLRGQRSAVLFAKERAAAGTDAAGTISLQEWLNARSALKGAAAPLLSVSNFSLENMEVRSARGRGCDCCRARGRCLPAPCSPPALSRAQHALSGQPRRA